MSQRQRIVIAQQQRLALNTSLHTAIRLLRSDTAGLTRYLEEQVAENPHLRLLAPEAPTPGDWLPRWTGVLGPSQPGRAGVAETAAPQPSLIAHVLAAIRALDLTLPAQRIALALVEALEPSGWLGRAPEAIAKDLGLPPEEVATVLERLQGLEPAGLFARTLAECLALQARDLGRLDHEMQVILAHLDLLAAGQTARLARLCSCDEAGVVARFRLIRTMNPKPGTLFAGASPTLSREPDLLARLDAQGHWSLALNRSALPSLSLETPPETDAAPEAARQRSAAKALCTMLQARNDTLLRVGQEMARRQRAALVEGPGALEPMTMAELAEALDLHVSTISRVVAGASMDSPFGVWWLRQMFSGARGLGRMARRGTERGDEANTAAAPAEGAGPVLSAAALRHRLGRIVAAEPATAPLSDAALADRLAEDTGVRLARRTVAQYREAERIPPAHRRKRLGFGARGGDGPATPRKRRLQADQVSQAPDVALDVPGDSP
jgi:RNA polymerase sigma-54 factor